MLGSMDMPVISADSHTGRDKLLKLAEGGGGGNSPNSKSVPKQKKQTVKSLKNKNNASKNGQSQDLSFTSNIEHLVRSSTPIAGRVPSAGGDNVSSDFVGNYICASHPSSRNGSPTKSQINDSPAHHHQSQHHHQQYRHEVNQIVAGQSQQHTATTTTPVLFSTSLTESRFGSMTATGPPPTSNSDRNASPSDLMFASLKIEDVNRHHNQQSVPYQSLSAGKYVHGTRIPNLRSSTTSSSNPRLLNDFGPLNRWPETEDLSKHTSHRKLFVDDAVPNACNTNHHHNQQQHHHQTPTPTNAHTNPSAFSRIPVFTNHCPSTGSAILTKSHSVHHQIHHHSNTSTGHYSTGMQRTDLHVPANPFYSGQNPFENGAVKSANRLFKSKTSDSFVTNSGQNSSSRIFDFNSPSTAVRVFENNQFDPSWFPVIAPAGAADLAMQTTSTPSMSKPVSTNGIVRDCNSSFRRVSTPLRPTHSSDNAAGLGISTPDQSFYEKFFLRETQKNVLAAITQNQKLNRSASCESFELFQQQALAEAPFADQNRNELNRLSHLEEEPREEESILNRFRKSFSLRFSKSNASSSAKCDSVNNDYKPLAVEPVDDAKSQTESQRDGDINQNTIFRPAINESNFVRVSTIERRKSRHDPFGRKSLRRSSRKSYRLKRSASQPTDKLLDGALSPNDLSFDSSDVESCKSPTMLNDTCSTTDLNDSHEKSDDVIYAEAIWDYTKSDAEELTFKAGDLIDVTDTSNKEWWWGAVTKAGETEYGWFPATYVRLKVSQEETIEEVLAKSIHEDDEDALKRMSMSKMSSEQVRSNIVLEIINSERDFVKNLTDVIDGYLKPCRDRQEMFSQIQIQTIFGNIEELHRFATQLLSSLEKCVNWNSLSASEIGNCFWNNEKGFSVYCDFCKNHPLAISELQDLYTDHRYIVFFEGCRLLQNMIDISLDGFLLTPIQKICKYPLQLGELLKHTRVDHPDYEPIQRALAAMQRVAQLVNDRKRRFESLEQLIALQEQFENWEGLPLIDSCSLLIHSGDVTRITSGSWSKDIHLMLFDHLLILCKKDSGLLKKGAYVFKCRIEMDNVDEVIAVEDNVKDTNFNVTTKNAFKFFYKPLQKWYLFQARSPAEKTKWMEAFAEERKRVQDDAESGFFVSESDKRGALISRQNNLKPRKPRSNRTAARPTTSISSIAAKKPDTVIADLPLGPILDRNRAGSLPSYIHHEVNAAYKQRQSTMHKKTRSNWFQLGSSKKKPRLKRNVK